MSRVFPASPGSGERDEPRVLAVEKLYDLPELALATEEGGGRNRKVRPIEALQGGELSVAELEDTFRSGEVFEAVLPEVGQLGFDERGGRRGDEHLAAVTRRRDASGAVDIVADITLVANERRARMDADAHSDRAVRCEALREVRCRAEGAVGRREGEEERVSLRVHLDAPVSNTRLPDR